jgi:hypothetical protein
MVAIAQRFQGANCTRLRGLITTQKTIYPMFRRTQVRTKPIWGGTYFFHKHHLFAGELTTILRLRWGYWMVLAHARLIWWQAPIGDVQPTKKYIVTTTTTTPVVNHRETRQLFPASNSFTKAANMSFLCSLAGRSSSRIRVWIPWLNTSERI